MPLFDKDEENNLKNAEKAKRNAEKKKTKAKKTLRMNLREKGIAAYGGGTIVAILILSVTTLVFGTFSVLLYTSNTTYSKVSAASYGKAYYQLVMDANNLETALSKAIVSSGNYKGRMLYEASSNAQSLQNNLAVLPSEKDEATSSAMKFCNQTMDYTKYLAQKAYDGKGLSEEEENNLKTLLETATAIKNSLNGSYENYGNSERLFFGGVFYGDYISPVDVTYDDLDESSLEYPTLIYDGPFSDVKELSEEELNEKSITIDEAIEIAKSCFGEDVSPLYEDENSDLAYTFSVGDGNTVIQLSKKNGDLLLVSKYREVGEKSLSDDDGIESCEKYLSSFGYNDVKVVWKSETDGILTVNFAQNVNDVICYSRLIKVVVALDNGEVLGMEGTTYVAKHENPVDTVTSITISAAKSALGKNLEIISSRPAVIPKNENEIMTYEFFVTQNGSEFYVYVDAKTGEEIEVLKVVDSKFQGQNVI